MNEPMRRTAWNDLAAPFVVVGALSYLILRVSYGAIPRLSFAPAAPLAALALIEFFIARRVRAAITHQPGAKPISALVIARYVALAKASALVGAGVLGALIALLLRVLPDFGRVAAARHDAYAAIVVLSATIGLVVAALLLERATLDPKRP